MTLERSQDGYITFSCDACGDVLDASRDFNEAQAELKSSGWGALKINEDWLHYCDSECRTTLYRENDLGN